MYAAGVDLYVAGHSHAYERFAPQNPAGQADANGIREFVVGTGGANFSGFGTVAANSQIRKSKTFGIAKLTLRAGSYDWSFVAVPARRTRTRAPARATEATGFPADIEKGHRCMTTTRGDGSNLEGPGPGRTWPCRADGGRSRRPPAARSAGG